MTRSPQWPWTGPNRGGTWGDQGTRDGNMPGPTKWAGLPGYGKSVSRIWAALPAYTGLVMVRADSGEVDHLRADAARNRARVAEAARSAFAELGVDAPIIEIARRAGVGTATLYRRFPTREDLLELVFEDRIQHCAATVDRFLTIAESDPWEAFAGYLNALFTLQREDRAFTAVLLHPFPSDGRMEHERQHVLTGLLKVICLGKKAAVVREDFTVADIMLLLRAHQGILATTDPESPAAIKDSERVSQLLMDACRPPISDDDRPLTEPRT